MTIELSLIILLNVGLLILMIIAWLNIKLLNLIREICDTPNTVTFKLGQAIPIYGTGSGVSNKLKRRHKTLNMKNTVQNEDNN